MGASVPLDADVAIPPGIESHDDFRRWALSDDFPERGRIDYVRSHVELDLRPERLDSHGAVKTEVGRKIANAILDNDLGNVYFDQARMSSVVGNLSCEPDVLVLLHKTAESGVVQLTPSVDGRDAVEIVGPPDLVVEIVGPDSVAKDTRRLPPAYFDAGVPEFWLIDARRDALSFQVFRRGETAFEPTPPDAEGFAASRVLGRRHRLDRARGRRDEWRYPLEERGHD